MFKDFIFFPQNMFFNSVYWIDGGLYRIWFGCLRLRRGKFLTKTTFNRAFQDFVQQLCITLFDTTPPPCLPPHNLQNRQPNNHSFKLYIFKENNFNSVLQDLIPLKIKWSSLTSLKLAYLFLIVFILNCINCLKCHFL